MFRRSWTSAPGLKIEPGRILFPNPDANTPNGEYRRNRRPRSRSRSNPASRSCHRRRARNGVSRRDSLQAREAWPSAHGRRRRRKVFDVDKAGASPSPAASPIMAASIISSSTTSSLPVAETPGPRWASAPGHRQGQTRRNFSPRASVGQNPFNPATSRRGAQRAVHP
jgi:hypothetical protein